MNRRTLFCMTVGAIVTPGAATNGIPPIADSTARAGAVPVAIGSARMFEGDLSWLVDAIREASDDRDVIIGL